MNITLDSDKFSTLIRILNIFKDSCSDVDIRNGIIRQKTNDSVSVFEIDLTSILGNISLPISDIKKKLDLFKIFSNQDVTIETGDDFYSISDSYSTIRLRFPSLEFMNNKFMGEEELNRVITISLEQLITDIILTEVISERIKKITHGFGVINLFVNVGDEISITASNKARDQSAVFVDKIIPTTTIDNKFYTSISIVPFIVDHDGDTLFKMYDIDGGKVLNHITLKNSNIDINIFCRSQTILDSDNREVE